MTITQTVEITSSRRLTVPSEVPEGRAQVIYQFPVREARKNSPRTIEEALQMAEEQAADPNRKPISRHFGTISPSTYGDGVAYQRAIRDEWD
jgi:hypothetical protein